jgi:hypothetical protein|tara:strand:+ start:2112 stop:3734 length:1623 start_codon:yes stop_codon:yes gene_type:complete
MSIIQLISDQDNSANYRVNFSDTINFNKSSKMALVNITSYQTFNINMDRLLKNFDKGKMKMKFKIGQGENIIVVDIEIDKDNFNNYDIFNVTLDDLLEVLTQEIDVTIQLRCFDGTQVSAVPVYNILFKKKTLENGTLGVILEAEIDRKLNLFIDIESYEPIWNLTDASFKSNMNLTVPDIPKSQSDTTTTNYAFCVTDMEDGGGGEIGGMAINGGYMRFYVETTDQTWSIGFTHDELDFTTTSFFDIDNTDKTIVYAPVVFRCIGDNTGQGGTIEIWKHRGDKDYTETPQDTDNQKVGQFNNVFDGDMIEIWFGANATILISCQNTTGEVIDHLIQGLDQEYLFSKADLLVQPPLVFIYTTSPSIEPVASLLYSKPNNVDSADTSVYYQWVTNYDNLFLPIAFSPGDFSDLLGFYAGSSHVLRFQDNGKSSLISTTNISTSIDSSEKLNVHIVNLPLVSYKNVPQFENKQYNGYSTTLLRDIPTHALGKINYDPTNLIYLDLKNPAERINDLQVEIRDATTNKITRSLTGTTILTIHLI